MIIGDYDLIKKVGSNEDERRVGSNDRREGSNEDGRRPGSNDRTGL